MSLKSLLIGSPLEYREETHQRMGKVVGLAILSSDALSSVAYASEQIMTTLKEGGEDLLRLLIPISFAIALLIALVSLSYFQTIKVFPKGGGAYVVAKNYLGRKSSLLAGSSLIIDYFMTVTVSVTAGIAAITSAFPQIYPHRIALCLLTLAILTIINLRGLKESGKAFTVPVYLFIISVFAMIVIGLFKDPDMQALPSAESRPLDRIGLLWIILRSFSSGCVALTGIEAIANGVQSFRDPEPRNARITLLWMAALLCAMFLGISFVAHQLGIEPSDKETVLSIATRKTFGSGFFYYLIQMATCLILILAANTAFNGFPQLSSMIAADGFLPKQLTSRGDRLVFSNGILLLSVVAGILILLFDGKTNPLIPLYTVGVFSAFTLSQAGMVRHWMEKKGQRWILGLIINGVGLLATCVVLVVVATTKFLYGAWIVLIAAPLLIWMMARIFSHYQNVQNQLDLASELSIPNYSKRLTLIPISGFHKTTLNALHYAQEISSDIEAIYVSLYPDLTKAVMKEWNKNAADIPLKVLESPSRSLILPIIRYIDGRQKADPGLSINVILPTLVPVKWWQQLLHNQTMMLIRILLLFKKNVVTINVPLHLRH